MVARQPDHPLDEVLARVLRQQPHERERIAHRGLQGALVRLGDVGQPTTRVLEHDDVTAVQVERARRQLADQDPVALDQGVVHRRARDEEGLHEEGLDEQRQDERAHDDDRRLAQPGHAHAAPGPPVLRRGCLELDVVALGRVLVCHAHTLPRPDDE